jgi:hypothetical protein
VAHGRKRNARKLTRVEKKTTSQEAPAHSLTLPNIARLVTYGKVSIEMLRPIGCVAIANDDDNTLAMLVRRKGETLIQLLTRLDQAIDKACNEDVFTDEINPKR